MNHEKSATGMIIPLVLIAALLIGCTHTGVPTYTQDPSTTTTLSPAESTPEPDSTTLPPETDLIVPPETLSPTEPPATTETPTEPPVTTEAPTEPSTAPPTTEPPTEPPVTEAPTEPPTVESDTDMKAMWLSQFDLYNVYTSGGAQRTEASFAVLIDSIMQKIADCGFNTVIVQVRPNADSMYPSAYFPMSSYVVGAYGKDASYDPLPILIEKAHAYGLSVHAWINPLRCMTTTQITQISSRYTLRQWYDDPLTNGTYLVASGNNYYLNPAYGEVRNLIVDGAREILECYDVDGLHMDDYFYPTTDAAFDATAYSEYLQSGGTASLADFRRGELNKLIAALYSAVKAIDSDLQFGISPAGNINTVYNSHYADVYTWCSQPGYLDYICPQVYFGMEHQSWDFAKTCKIWQDIITREDIDLIIGMTLGKALSGEDAYAGTGKYEWRDNKDVLLQCLQTTKDFSKCQGVAYFCYQYFYDPVSGTSVAETQTERDNFLPLLKQISWRE